MMIIGPQMTPATPKRQIPKSTLMLVTISCKPILRQWMEYIFSLMRQQRSTNRMQMQYSWTSSILMRLTKSTPIQGRKKGNMAMEASTVDTIRLMGVISNISSSIKEMMKCSTTISMVACIKSVMDEISSCLLKEKISFILLLLLQYLEVRINVVVKVVKLNNELETVANIQARLPKKSLNKLDPVENTLCRPSLLASSAMPLQDTAFSTKEYQVQAISSQQQMFWLIAGYRFTYCARYSSCTFSRKNRQSSSVLFCSLNSCTVSLMNQFSLVILSVQRGMVELPSSRNDTISHPSLCSICYQTSRPTFVTSLKKTVGIATTRLITNSKTIIANKTRICFALVGTTFWQRAPAIFPKDKQKIYIPNSTSHVITAQLLVFSIDRMHSPTVGKLVILWG